MSKEDEVEITDESVTEALERIAKDDTDGLVQPAAVVDQARDPKSPLHRYFEWDDNEAAEQYRLYQARNLIARVKIVYEDPNQSNLKYVSVSVTTVKGGARRGYVPIERAAADPDLYEQVVRDAQAGMIAYRNRLSAFQTAHAIVLKIDAAIKETKKIDKK